MNNDILHVCDNCIKEHKLKSEEGYKSIRPCVLCIKYNKDNTEKPTLFVRWPLHLIDMNKARRKLGMNPLAPIKKE